MPETTTIHIAKGTIVAALFNAGGKVERRQVTLTADALVEATRLNDGCWGYAVDRHAYICAGGLGHPLPF